MKQELDYKKLYEDALERAKAYHRNELSGTRQEMTEYIFPELAESEDERIRKCVEYIVKCFAWRDGFEPVTKEKCLAWLEKQKERGVVKGVKINNLPPVTGNNATDIRPWKPAKEQMDALQTAWHTETLGAVNRLQLESLYNELMEISKDKTFFWDRNDFPEEATDEEILKSLISLINWSGTPWSSSDKDKYKAFLNNMFEFSRHGFENGFVSERNRIRARVQDCLRPYLAKSDRQRSYHDTGIIKGLNWVLDIIDDGIKV